MCLDAAGLANGNDGPFVDEGRHMSPRQMGEEVVTPTDGDLTVSRTIFTLRAWPAGLFTSTVTSVRISPVTLSLTGRRRSTITLSLCRVTRSSTGVSTT